jgi:LmbE family N-acetylglucosaminyl deacetylase
MKVLVIAVHPDDETLGCGGTILKHIENKDEVAWLIITNVKEEYNFSNERVISRNNEIALVAKEYGFSKVYNLGFKPSGLTSENQSLLIDDISNVMNEFKPETVYMINRSDAHSDHRYAFQASFACTKAFRYPFIKKVLMYECISETEFAPALPENIFIPNYFVEITSEQLEKKLAIIKIFNSELAPPPFPRSMRNMAALADFRGASAGVMHAEAFQLLKFIDK